MRKLGFYRDKLTLIEIIGSLTLLSFWSISFFYNPDNFENEFTKIINTVLFMFLWWIPLSTPISEKFRNIYVFVIWIIICVLFTQIMEYPSSILPIIILIYVHICRLIFKVIFKIEPIPLLAYWYPIERFSKIEKRKSNKRDFYFTFIVFIIGGILSIWFTMKN